MTNELDEIRQRLSELARRETLMVLWYNQWSRWQWAVSDVSEVLTVTASTWPRPCAEHDDGNVCLGLVTLEPRGDTWVASGTTPCGDHFSVDGADRDECIRSLRGVVATY